MTFCKRGKVIPIRKLVDQFNMQPIDITKDLGPAGINSANKKSQIVNCNTNLTKKIEIEEPVGRKKGNGPTPMLKNTM